MAGTSPAMTDLGRARGRLALRPFEGGARRPPQGEGEGGNAPKQDEREGQCAIPG